MFRDAAAAVLESARLCVLCFPFRLCISTPLFLCRLKVRALSWPRSDEGPPQQRRRSGAGGFAAGASGRAFVRGESRDSRRRRQQPPAGPLARRRVFRRSDSARALGSLRVRATLLPL